MNVPFVYVVFSTLKDKSRGAIEICPTEEDAKERVAHYRALFGNNRVEYVEVAAALMEHAVENY